MDDISPFGSSILGFATMARPVTWHVGKAECICHIHYRRDEGRQIQAEEMLGDDFDKTMIGRKTAALLPRTGLYLMSCGPLDRNVYDIYCRYCFGRERAEMANGFENERVEMRCDMIGHRCREEDRNRPFSFSAP